MKINTIQKNSINPHFGIKITKGERVQRLLDRAIEQLGSKDTLEFRFRESDIVFKKYPFKSYDFVLQMTERLGPIINRGEYFYSKSGFLLYKETNNSHYQIIIGAKSTKEQDMYIKSKLKKTIGLLLNQNSNNIVKEVSNVKCK